MRRVVITGMGTVNPLGNNVPTTTEKLFKGEVGIDYITKFDIENFPIKIAGELKNFDPSSIIDKKEARRMDPYIQYAVVSSKEAIEYSKLDLDKIDKEKVGVIIASGIGGINTWVEQHTNFLKKGPRRVSPFFIPMMISNMASGQVAIKFGFKGPNYAITSACASSGHAIVAAYRIIQRGEANLMLSGGSEAAVTPLALAGFSVMKALSTRNDDPKTSSRPFDNERDGFVLSEGAGMLVLEEYEHAKARGAQILCEICGAGQTDDAFHITAPDETGTGPALAMTNAVKDSKINKEEIDHINAHGTSTPYNDKIETLAIKKAFGEHAKKISVVSTKSMTGHLLGAGSAVEVIAIIASMKKNMLHPTMNLVNPDPNCDLDYVPNKARNFEIKNAISNSLGFGGHNASIVISKYE